MYKVAWLGLLLATAAVRAQEGPPRLLNPDDASRPASLAGTEEGPSQAPERLSWQRELAQLRSEREALEAERKREGAEHAVAGSASEDQIAQLRQRVNQLLTKMALQSARS